MQRSLVFDDSDEKTKKIAPDELDELAAKLRNYLYQGRIKRDSKQ